MILFITETAVEFGDRPRKTLDFIGYRGVCPQRYVPKDTVSETLFPDAHNQDSAAYSPINGV